MKDKIKKTLFLLALTITSIGYAQVSVQAAVAALIPNPCATPSPYTGLPAATVVTIPVVVHVIHNGEAEGSGRNISKALIDAQIAQLNLDFGGGAVNLTATPQEFKHVFGNTKIQFKLATKRPDGVKTTGIERLNRFDAYFGLNQAKDEIMTPSTDTNLNISWDNSKYLNIYILDLDENETGAVYGFGTSSSTRPFDGLVLDYSTVGSLLNPNPNPNSSAKTLAQSVNRFGRVATHELGHYFGLLHIWGGTDVQTCKNDGIADTPQHSAANNTSVYVKNGKCGTTVTREMSCNFMDYTPDKFMTIFTNCQRESMRKMLATSRAGLITSTGLSVGTCGVVTGLSVSDVAVGAATLTWSEMPGATSYKITYNYLNSGTTVLLSNTTSATTNFKLITCPPSVGTSPNNKVAIVSFTVQPVCGGTVAPSLEFAFSVLNQTIPTATGNLKGPGLTRASATSLNSLSMYMAYGKISQEGEENWYKCIAGKIGVKTVLLPKNYNIELYKGNETTPIKKSKEFSFLSDYIAYFGTANTTYYIKVFSRSKTYSPIKYYIFANTNPPTETARMSKSDESDDAISLDTISLYPNPTSGEFSLNIYNAKDQAIEINIFDLLGKNVMTMQLTAEDEIVNQKLDISQLPKGVYMVKITIDGQEYNKKIVKQ